MGVPIEMTCGSCGKLFKVADGEVGDVYSCPHCAARNRASRPLAAAQAAESREATRTHEKSAQPLNNLAVGSVALAIAGLFLFGVLAGLGAVCLGFVAKRQTEKGRGRGLRLAIAGIWGGVLVSALSLGLSCFSPEPPPVVIEAVPPQVTTWPGLIQHVFDSFRSG